MFFIHHPRPLIDGRAVAVQVVQQKTAREPVLHVLVPRSREVLEVNKTSGLAATKASDD